MKPTTKGEPFDLESVYDEQIAPLMTQIIAICKEHNMPMIATFCYRMREDGWNYCTTIMNKFDGRYNARIEDAFIVVERGTELLDQVEKKRRKEQ